MLTFRLVAAAALGASIGLLGCTSLCDNAGVSVDRYGNIVVKGENGFVSPNSSILKNVVAWPSPPAHEQNFSFQGYALSRNGTAIYLLANTAQHPNLVYYVDLKSGKMTPVGSSNAAETGGAQAGSKETWIAVAGGYVYSVDQGRSSIDRGQLAHTVNLSTFIGGARTALRAPIGVAVDQSGKVCALDSATLFVLCYAPSEHGNASPVQTIDTAKLLGYRQVDTIAFGTAGELAISGTGDTRGLGDFSIAVFDLTSKAPRLLKTISGENTNLRSPQSIAVDPAGNILVLQASSTEHGSASEVIAFAPGQQGNVKPISTRNPATAASHAFRMAVDKQTGDVAILASDGVAYFAGAARRAPDSWPAEQRFQVRGWDVALSRDELVVANEFGAPKSYALAGLAKRSAQLGAFDLHDPAFVASDPAGRIYTASSDGVISELPPHPNAVPRIVRTFETPFGRNMTAFASGAGGYFYFTSSSNNAIVVVGPHGSQSLLRGISTELDNPYGLAVGRDGTLLVANAGGKDILVFARGSRGNVAPAGRIAGGKTALVEPRALATDAAGRLYVFDSPTVATDSEKHYVRVFGAGARGDVAPLRSYEVTTKCWVNAP